MMNSKGQRKGQLENAELEKVTGGQGKLRGTFRQEFGNTIYQNSDGNCYRMLPDGSWVFVCKK